MSLLNLTPILQVLQDDYADLLVYKYGLVNFLGGKKW